MRLYSRQNTVLIAPSRPTKGRSRSSRTRDGMRWTRMAPLTNGAERGRRSRVVLTPRRWRQVLRSDAQGDGDNKARSPGRSRRKPLKPPRAGMPGCSGEPTVTTSCALYPILHARLRVHQAPGIPHALLGRKPDAQLGRIRVVRTQTLARRSPRGLPRTTHHSSSPRTRGPITTGSNFGRPHQPATFNTSGTAYGSLRPQGRHRLSSQPRLTTSSSPRRRGRTTARAKFVPTSSNSISQHERHGVWVPASAGTTNVGSDATHHPSSPRTRGSITTGSSL